AHVSGRVPKGECPLKPGASSVATHLLIFAVVLRASLCQNVKVTLASCMCKPAHNGVYRVIF
ncbi:hypothetical protein, partial [Escherichia coli]|uniref:hypothetical protein n=1 Tax=Escherichia coli TaxID=562 RepID=UPI001ABD357B